MFTLQRVYRVEILVCYFWSPGNLVVSVWGFMSIFSDLRVTLEVLGGLTLFFFMAT